MKAIYKIINKINGKFYLGSTKNTSKRKSTHFSQLRHNKHHCIHLQRAFNKYKEENFEFEVITRCEDCLKEEQPYLDSLNWNNCYNVSKFVGGGDNLSNHPNREQIVKKLTEILNNHRHKIKPRFKEENGNWKCGKTFCKCGNRINSNNLTCSKCQDKTGINNPFYNKHHSEETKKKLSEKNKKRGYVGSQEKSVIINKIEYKSVSEAGRKLKVTSNTIINRIRNKNFPEYLYKNEYLTTIETTCSKTGQGSRVESSDSKRKQSL